MSEENSEIMTIKLIVIGSCSAGKTSFVCRYASNTFNKTHLSTLGIDYKDKTIKYGNKTLRIRLWDTAGQERFQSISKNYYKSVHGIIICFDLSMNDIESEIKTWEAKVFSEVNKSTPILYVGTKCDLVSNSTINYFCQFLQLENMKGIYISSKKNVNVESAVNMIIQLIMEKQKVSPETEVKSVSLNTRISKKEKKCCK